MHSKNKDVRKNRTIKECLVGAATFALEQMEDRVLLSTTLAAWQFETLPASQSTSAIESVVPSTSGNGTAYTVGMENGTLNDGYLYPTPSARNSFRRFDLPRRHGQCR